MTILATAKKSELILLVISQKTNKSILKINRMQTMAAEMLKTINSVKPSYMKKLFSTQHPTRSKQKKQYFKNENTKSYGKKSISL